MLVATTLSPAKDCGRRKQGSGCETPFAGFAGVSPLMVAPPLTQTTCIPGCFQPASNMPLALTAAPSRRLARLVPPPYDLINRSVGLETKQKLEQFRPSTGSHGGGGGGGGGYGNGGDERKRADSTPGPPASAESSVD